ncbi:MAG: hypothetical protein GYB68_15425 [Chloroflexi bacterium]|nr:hypothetical protein [Chloroflexota bacterium]
MQIIQIAKADFLQRVRAPSFMIMLILTAILSTLFVPPLDANYAVLTLGEHRLRYNSVGIGLMFAFTISVLLSLFAFYIVRNTVQRDRQTRVGQIIATTQTSTVTYLIGKWASNLTLLSANLALMTIMAPIMQLLRAEVLTINIVQLVLLIWLVGLPVMSLVAGVAVLFETIPFLRGGFGNIAYFFVWTFSLASLGLIGTDLGISIYDPFGIAYPWFAVYAQPNAPSIQALNLLGGSTRLMPVLDVYPISWSLPAIIGRLSWMAAGAGVAVLGVIPFDRFAKPQGRKLVNLWEKLFPKQSAASGAKAFEVSRLTPLATDRVRSRFLSVIIAELRLLIKGQPWWWLVGLGGIVILGLLEPRPELMVAVTIWPVLVWSAQGNREKTHDTAALIYTTPHPVVRQLPATYLAGVILTAVLMSGFMLQLTLSGAWLALTSVLSGVLLIPALALALGTISGTARLFEISFLIWWYIALNASGFPALHPMLTDSPATIPVYLAVTAALLMVATLGRLRMVVQ